MINVKDIQYNAAGGINCQIQLDKLSPWFPFTASADDQEQFGRELYAKLIAGEWGLIAPVLLAEAKAVKEGEILDECRRRIISGFTSNALGQIFTYPSDEASQLNLNASVLSSLLPGNPADWVTPFLCSDSTGVWTYRVHTAAQIQRVGMDAKAAILSCLMHKNALFERVKTATTAQEITAIIW